MLFRHEPGSLPPASAGASGGVVIERPPPGLARGKYPASPWVIALLGAALVLGTLSYFLFRSKDPRS